MQNPRHFGKFQNEEVLVIGYKKTGNVLMIVKINALPIEDQTTLRSIATSPAAQNVDYLIPLLTGEPHRSGKDWFTFLANNQRSGITMQVSPTKVEDMNSEQYNYWAGWGNSIREQTQTGGRPPMVEPAPASQAAPLTEVPHQVSAPVDPAMPAVAEALYDTPTQVEVAAVAPAVDPVMAQLAQAMSSIADTQGRMVETLDKIEKRSRPGPKAGARKRKPAAKAVTRGEAA